MHHAALKDPQSVAIGRCCDRSDAAPLAASVCEWRNWPELILWMRTGQVYVWNTTVACTNVVQN
jgi:hypothetical protein